jgi:hypothetical protein
LVSSKRRQNLFILRSFQVIIDIQKLYLSKVYISMTLGYVHTCDTNHHNNTTKRIIFQNFLCSFVSL